MVENNTEMRTFQVKEYHSMHVTCDNANNFSTSCVIEAKTCETAIPRRSYYFDKEETRVCSPDKILSRTFSIVCKQEAFI